ncbi:hypothetical protein Kpol_1004p41 [Vanderwaltozyma polyspora DSM 70294]|uniref:Uncharacterized protein n=1 Tax=Vanderwaltozyma polyspora (strain ATCC 22028 / DSM 70294 / BCRC 21397 / CBS 2163 / NBRC 10782 / NRRL Y-8283 / UCD 57-17) TaxID=436907 RepID=A7TJ97_VANPO|nr:uncharacterized protein Kpol_1004p41 [Vanderwaltozyma polyspora DSM 70294]EDO17666.1 hypothetical protein Kpol_1004p41 [Vanderwaltozyma polyspora DSM 70294]
MSTTLQLLANYYKSVIEGERIYYENVIGKEERQQSSNDGSTLTKSSGSDTLMLQRQITQLNTDLQVLRHENEQLKEMQKTHRALMESKLKSSKKIIENLKNDLRNNNNTDDQNNGEQNTIDINKEELQHSSRISTMVSKKIGFQLLSPMNERLLRGTGRNTDKNQLSGLRYVISTGKHTIFDESYQDDTDNSKDDGVDGVLLANPVKNVEKLANLVLPSDALSDGNTSPTPRLSSSHTETSDRNEHYKKRKLARKRIQNLDSDDSLQ